MNMADGAQKHPYHLVDPSPWPALGAIGAFLLAMGASVLVLGVTAFRWDGFDPIGGAAGVSAVVAAIVVEGFVRGGGE